MVTHLCFLHGYTDYTHYTCTSKACFHLKAQGQHMAHIIICSSLLYNTARLRFSIAFGTYICSCLMQIIFNQVACSASGEWPDDTHGWTARKAPKCHKYLATLNLSSVISTRPAAVKKCQMNALGSCRSDMVQG